MTRSKGSVFVSIFCSGKENDFHWFNIYFFLAVVYAMLVAFRPTYRWFRWMFRFLKESRIDTIVHTISTSSKIIQNRMESYYESNGLYLDALRFYVFVCFFGLTMLKFCFWRFSFLFYWFAFFVYELVRNHLDLIEQLKYPLCPSNCFKQWTHQYGYKNFRQFIVNLFFIGFKWLQILFIYGYN